MNEATSSVRHHGESRGASVAQKKNVTPTEKQETTWTWVWKHLTKTDVGEASWAKR